MALRKEGDRRGQLNRAEKERIPAGRTDFFDLRENGLAEEDMDAGRPYRERHRVEVDLQRARPVGSSTSTSGDSQRGPDIYSGRGGNSRIAEDTEDKAERKEISADLFVPSRPLGRRIARRPRGNASYESSRGASYGGSRGASSGASYGSSRGASSGASYGSSRGASSGSAYGSSRETAYGTSSGTSHGARDRGRSGSYRQPEGYRSGMQQGRQSQQSRQPQQYRDRIPAYDNTQESFRRASDRPQQRRYAGADSTAPAKDRPDPGERSERGEARSTESSRSRQRAERKKERERELRRLYFTIGAGIFIFLFVTGFLIAFAVGRLRRLDEIGRTDPSAIQQEASASGDADAASGEEPSSGGQSAKSQGEAGQDTGTATEETGKTEETDKEAGAAASDPDRADSQGTPEEEAGAADASDPDAAEPREGEAEPADTAGERPAEGEADGEHDAAEIRPDGEGSAEETAADASGGTDDGTSVIPYAKNDWRLVLVNRDHSLPENFTVNVTTLVNGESVDSRCYPELMSMLQDCMAAGGKPVVCSSFRTREKQIGLYTDQVNQELAKGLTREEAEREAGTQVAYPGTSEHELGLAVDICDEDYQTLDDAQADTFTQQWLMQHCWDYGFILRYPPEKSAVTGIIFEPWHYRYVGTAAASEIHERGICLEEYLEEN